MGFSETLFLFLLALLIFGPKKLPEIARQIGKALNEFKRASNEFKAQIASEVSQLELEHQRQQLTAGTPVVGSVPTSVLHTERSGTLENLAPPVTEDSPKSDVPVKVAPDA
jgi:sec-independent protein translocase protein TatB